MWVVQMVQRFEVLLVTKLEILLESKLGETMAYELVLRKVNLLEAGLESMLVRQLDQLMAPW
jgi:hypothetical protein